MFPKSVSESLYDRTQKKMDSYALGCFGVGCSKVEQWSVRCMCEIQFADVNRVSVFYGKISHLILFQESQSSDNYYP